MKRLTLKERQEKLDKLKKTLYFTDPPRNDEIKNVKLIVKKAIKMEEKRISSFYGSYTSFYMTSTTSSSSKREQTLGSSRSMEDLYLLCKHYIPNTTLDDVRRALLKLPISNHFCHSFNKMMYHYRKGGRIPTKKTKDYLENMK